MWGVFSAGGVDDGRHRPSGKRLSCSMGSSSDGPSVSALERALSALVGSTRELCSRLQKMQVKLGLEDLRKSI